MHSIVTASVTEPTDEQLCRTVLLDTCMLLPYPCRQHAAPAACPWMDEAYPITNYRRHTLQPHGRNISSIARIIKTRHQTPVAAALAGCYIQKKTGQRFRLRGQAVKAGYVSCLHERTATNRPCSERVQQLLLQRSSSKSTASCSQNQSILKPYSRCRRFTIPQQRFEEALSHFSICRSPACISRQYILCLLP